MVICDQNGVRFFSPAHPPFEWEIGVTLLYHQPVSDNAKAIKRDDFPEFKISVIFYSVFKAFYSRCKEWEDDKKKRRKVKAYLQFTM